MRNLKAYVEQTNKWRRLFNEGEVDLTRAKDVQAMYERLQVDLSPENLCCDGELRGRALQTKTKMLKGALEEIRVYAEKNGFALKEFDYGF